MEDRAVKWGIPVNPGDLVDGTDPVDREDAPVNWAEGVSTDFVPHRVIFAARERLIGRLGSVDLDRLPIGGVAEAVSETWEGRRSDPESN